MVSAAKLRLNGFIFSLQCALGALYQEILGFRFNYPLDVVEEAGPKGSLEYYLYSDRLSWSVMRMDTAGVPRVRGRLYGEVYKPGYIAWWGLVNLGHYLRNNVESSRETFLRQVDWLEGHAEMGPAGSVTWPNRYHSLEGHTPLKAPWVSSHDQGLAISALVRGYRLTRKPQLLDLLRGAHVIYRVETRHGGLRAPVKGGAIYVERPGTPVPGILDGFLTSLLGLHDLWIETGNPEVESLFREGLLGLKGMLPLWDYRNKWSWYATRAYLCPPTYHVLNRNLISVLAKITGDAALSTCADQWNPDHLSWIDRLEIYLGFLMTKNRCRLRVRTWRHNRDRVLKVVAGDATESTLNPVSPDVQTELTSGIKAAAELSRENGLPN